MAVKCGSRETRPLIINLPSTVIDNIHTPPPPSFCSYCGGDLLEKLLPTEDRPRLVCPLGHVTYVNPKIIANIIPERDGRILLMRRGIEPRYGYWTMPGGFVEIDESPEDAAIREASEEVNLDVNLNSLVGIYSKPAPDGPGIVALVFRGTTDSGNPTPSREALEVAWFSPEEIPWDDLAYETTHWALRDWLKTTRANS